MALSFPLIDEAATAALGSLLAAAVRAAPNEAIASPRAVYLQGEMGSGKSTLARGFLRALGVVGRIKSPTYALVENYFVEFNVNSKLDLYHFDLYRFIESSEWRGAGFSDLIQPGTMSLIEWPEKALDHLPPPDLTITLTHQSHQRQVCITAGSPIGQTWLAQMAQTHAHAASPSQ